jgi:hypothetical protein
MHVDGVDNKVADCLSRYSKNDMGDESHPEHIYVNADARLDPDSELLLTNRYIELKTAATRRSNCLAEKKEARIVESEEMNGSTQQALPEDTPPSEDYDDIAVTAASSDCWVHTCTRADFNPNIFLSPNFISNSVPDDSHTHSIILRIFSNFSVA